MAAENPSNVKLKYKKFYQVRKLACKNVKEQMAFDMNTQLLGNILLKCDTQPAVVYSLDPFIISAYSDEFDAVIFLQFPDELAKIYDLSVGDRLVTACNYVDGGKTASDIFPGPAASGLYSDMMPVVQLFFAGKKQLLFAGGDDEIRARASIFAENVWARVNELTQDYAAKGLSRDGVFYMR